MTSETVRFDFPAGLEQVTDVRCEAERMAERMGFPVEDTAKIGTSAWEATVNAVTHGSPRGSDQHVQVVIESDDGTLTMTVSSENPKVELPEAKPKPSVSLRGRGLTIIRAFMDEVHLEEDGQYSLVMVKHLPHAANGQH